MKQLRIGRLAGLAGVSAHTVRFYERKGLLPETGRSEAGYRQYGEDAVRRLVFIRRAKALGFTLREIADRHGDIVVNCSSAVDRIRNQDTRDGPEQPLTHKRI